MFNFFRNKDKDKGQDKPVPGNDELTQSAEVSAEKSAESSESSGEQTAEATLEAQTNEVPTVADPASVVLTGETVDLGPIPAVQSASEDSPAADQLKYSPDSDVKTPEPDQESKPVKKSWFGRLKSKLLGGDKTEQPAEATAEAVPEEKPEEIPEVISEVIPEVIPEVPTAVALEEIQAQEVPRLTELAVSEGETISAEVTTASEDLGETLAEPAEIITEQSPETAVSAPDIVPEPAAEMPEQSAESEEPQEAKPAKLGWFARLKQKLASTRAKISGRLEAVLSSVRVIDENVLEELEEILITSDIGIKTTEDLLYKIRGQVKKKELKDSAALKAAIRERLLEVITVTPKPVPEVKPLVIMVVGVNGVGKTTTIAKMTKRFQDEGKSVLLAAGDTFRAAAVEQLTIWADRLNADIVSQPTGADASAVVFDALTAAQARKADVVIIDTAGRLHTKVNLMEELKKIKRVANKALPGAPHETVLILDANTGQNGANQARTFHESVGVDSLIITKLDGTSKGGVVISIINELKLPVTFIGLGETYDDMRPFVASDFVDAIMEI
jgi:fused signal recognition particle receptor